MLNGDKQDNISVRIYLLIWNSFILFIFFTSLMVFAKANITIIINQI